MIWQGVANGCKVLVRIHERLLLKNRDFFGYWQRSDSKGEF